MRRKQAPLGDERRVARSFPPIGTPVIAHPSTVLDKDAYAPNSTHVIDKAAMAKLREAATAYAIGIKDTFDNPAQIKAHLNANRLLAAQFLEASTLPVKKQA
jgi:hypothetical protein